MGHMTQATVS